MLLFILIYLSRPERETDMSQLSPIYLCYLCLKLPRIARVDSHFVWEMVVESKIRALCVGGGELIALTRTVTEGLLHTEDRFQTPQPTIGTIPLRQTIRCFYPIALCMRAVRVL
jgi:hypothetical protein